MAIDFARRTTVDGRSYPGTTTAYAIQFMLAYPVAESDRIRTLAGSGVDSNDHEDAKTRRSGAVPTLVIGFVGGFVHSDDLRHSEPQIAPPFDGHKRKALV
jgi:hypothetical protein